MSLKNKKIFDFNRIFIPMLQSNDGIMNHKIKIKIAGGEVARPLGIPNNGPFKNKDTWQLKLGCKKCDREQVILFPFTTNATVLQYFIGKLLQQMNHFEKEYCTCGNIKVDGSNNTFLL